MCPVPVLLVLSLVVPTCATLSLSSRGGTGAAPAPAPGRDTTTTVLYSARAAAREAAAAGSESAGSTPGEAGASLPSRLLYGYAGPLLDKASAGRLEASDALELEGGNRMDRSVPVLEDAYRRRRDAAGRTGRRGGSRTVLAKALLESQRSTLLLTGTLRLLNTAIQAFPSVLIARLLRRIEGLGPGAPPGGAVASAVQLVAVLSLKMVVENAYFHNVVKCGARVRGSLGGMIFDKSLRLGSAGAPSSRDKDRDKDGKKGDSKDPRRRAAEGAGGVLNLMTSDAANIEALTLQLHTVWDGLLQIAIYVTLLYRYLGPSVLYGVAVLLTTVPLNAATLRVVNRLNAREMESRDDRMRKTTESIGSMDVLKAAAWDGYFLRDVRGHRDEELRRHARRGSVRALNQAVSNTIPTATLVVTLAMYARSGRPVVASTIFTAISLFNQLRFPLFFYPMLIDSLSNGRNSLGRIAEYLNRDEIVPYVREGERLDLVDGRTGGVMKGGSVELAGGDFLWSGPAEASNADGDYGATRRGVPALRDAAASVGPGEVVAVVGGVGSGKTALCRSLIGELVPSGPAAGADGGGPPLVGVRGPVAYCAQEAWLPRGTIRDSVVFGRDFDQEKYDRAIYSAGLDQDIMSGVLSHDTDVGEGGSSLSGGQRARVALARALYDEDAGVFVLDDPLSALDASVGAVVFDRAISKARDQNAATVLVTNDPNLPRRCDRVVLMGPDPRGGSRVVDVGTYDELISRGHDLRTISHDGSAGEDQDGPEVGVTSGSDSGGPVAARGENSTPERVPSHADPDCRVALEEDPALLAEHAMPESPDEPAEEEPPASARPERRSQLSADDTMATGAVPRATYLQYFKSVKSPALILAALASYFVSNGAQSFQQLIIARWTEVGKGGSVAAAMSGRYLNQLVFVAGLVSVGMFARSYLTMKLGVRASRTLHEDMLRSVFRAPLSFFSATPSGQILSRFGKELEVVDRSLPDGIGSVMYCFLNIFFSALALAGAVSPGMAAPLALVGWFYVGIMRRFRRAARDLKRSESKSRSPIYTHFKEALRGAETIRAIPTGRESWSGRYRRLTDDNNAVFLSVKSLDRWLSIRLESLGNVVVLAAATASVFLTRAGRLRSGSAGWGITQALSITGLLTWAVRCLTDSETHFMSILRIAELSDLDTEETEIRGFENRDKTPNGGQSYENDLLKSGWPWRGEVQFNDVSMRYNPGSPLVLKNVSVNVPPGSTLGIVGRTGSGKSSLLLSLFRLVEVEGGSIVIDGVDIRSLSLNGLRDSLSIIPQTPTLFSGTLLYNLDASGRSSPEEAWNALESASPELARQFRESEGGLLTKIDEGGENLSLGQRQLICLARALLKKSKILVLDEATSSVDTKTDAQVQETIRREFVEKGATVITVAHRLDTVLSYDRILVLDDGMPVELGAPSELLRLQKGYLRRLYESDRENIQKGRRTRVTAR